MITFFTCTYSNLAILFWIHPVLLKISVKSRIKWNTFLSVLYSTLYLAALKRKMTFFFLWSFFVTTFQCWSYHDDDFADEVLEKRKRKRKLFVDDSSHWWKLLPQRNMFDYISNVDIFGREDQCFLSFDFYLLLFYYSFNLCCIFEGFFYPA